MTDDTGRVTLLERGRQLLRLDLAPSHRQPSGVLVVLATAGAVVGSLLADELLVHAGTALFPATRHFSHFGFSDYATLTVVGVLAACASWPIVTRVSSSPRWLFFRLAIAVTLALWIPDVWLLIIGETARGVAVLMVMHLAIALVTYNVLVHGAPVRSAPAGSAAGPAGTPRLRRLSARAVRRAWNAMALLVAAELVLGVVTIVLVPYRRGDAVVPSRGTWIYVAHGAVGGVLGAGALMVLIASAAADRLARVGAVLGACGVTVGLVGGLLATFEATRLVGVVLMLAGVVVAGTGYLVPALEEFGRAERERAELERAERERERRERAEHGHGRPARERAGAPPGIQPPAP